MLLNVYLVICDDVKEEKNNTQVFIPQVFKLLARTYANAHETMSNENARCGSSRTNSQKGIINGAQWSSIAGSELKEVHMVNFIRNEMSDGATRGRCKTRSSEAGPSESCRGKVSTVSHVVFLFSVQACKTSTTFTPTVLR